MVLVIDLATGECIDRIYFSEEPTSTEKIFANQTIEIMTSIHPDREYTTKPILASVWYKQLFDKVFAATLAELNISDLSGVS